MNNKVSIIDCDNYDSDCVNTAVNNMFNTLGGIEKFVKPNEKVFVKINLLMKKSPEEATTTHPVIVEEIVKIIQNAGGIVTIGDSPGGPYTKENLKNIYDATGMTGVADRTSCQLNFDTGSKNVKSNGFVSQNLDIINPVLESDKIIAIGKLKTHALMTATLAIKLCFGYIPGLIKRDYHLRMPNPNDFANLLIDIFEVRKPYLNIIDAVIGMEGDGPSAGTPKKVGCIIASENGYALDIVGSSIMCIDPQSVPTIMMAKERKLYTKNLDEIEMVGEKIEKYITKFKHPKIRRIDKYIEMVPRIFKNFLQPRPVFVSTICTGCAHCIRSCPAKAITLEDKKAIVNLDKCIRCYCCHELCPHKAIEIKNTIASKILSKF